MKTIKERIINNDNTFVVTANPEIVMYAQHHKNYLNMIKKSNYITPDGIGIIKGANMLNQPMPERITGYDIFLDLLKWGNKYHKSAYFLGAKPNVIKDLKQILNNHYSNLKISGIHDGYFKNDKRIVKDIQIKQPDMVFVALGFPKQEEFITKNRNVNDKLWIGLGGSFDSLTGYNKRAPKFWIKHNIEWLYRLINNPKRIIRMISLPKFLIKVYKQKRGK